MPMGTHFVPRLLPLGLGALQEQVFLHRGRKEDLVEQPL